MKVLIYLVLWLGDQTVVLLCSRCFWRNIHEGRKCCFRAFRNSNLEILFCLFRCVDEMEISGRRKPHQHASHFE
jgi:hypothetical protein